MTQQERTMDFIRLIDREVTPVPRHGGFDLERRGHKPRIGYVRFNVGGDDRGTYRVYAYEPFGDPQGRFENHSEGNPRGWTCVVHPNDVDDVRYVVSVLESSYDQR